MIFSYEKNFEFLTTVLKIFGLRPYEPLVAVAVAEGAKPLATAVDIRPSVDLCLRRVYDFSAWSGRHLESCNTHDGLAP